MSNNCGGEICDSNYMRYVGWDESNPAVQSLYSKETIKLISKKVTELTRGVDPENRPILVPDNRICEVLDGIYSNYRPNVGDIYTRYILPNNAQQDQVASVIDQAIEIIVGNIRNQIGMERNNEKLTAWIQLYGDFNTGGLRQHAPIKIREKRPSTMQFFQNY
jgi:hypothetical protein